MTNDGSMNITDYQTQVLNALDDRSGMLTGDVAKEVSPQFGHSRRTHSAAVKQWLLGLEKRGLVSRMDNQKPVLWVRCSAQNTLPTT